MPRAAFLFVFVGLFGLAWSNDPGLAAAPKCPPTRTSSPAGDAVPTPTESVPDDVRALAERETRCT